MHKNTTFLILFGTLLVAGGVVLYERQKLDSVTVPPVSTNNQQGEDDKPIATVLDGADENGWKTLRSELFGFEMKFPGEWEVILPYHPISRATLSQRAEGEDVFSVVFRQPDEGLDKFSALGLGVSKIGIEEKLKRDKEILSSTYKVEMVSVGNAKGFKINQEKNNYSYIIFGSEKYTFQFSNINDLPGNREAYEKMLPTFHLLP
ncbi:MAG: hypothetical protein A2756_05585 [Candidatus Ryanbacteria bacterium RIFCSPHIGHO2_01_FULL_48_27]|uniref:PsbP C-terminal domain-containing protein n=1 Tax=Candidatus Ryanbacteria bacterium RIFCSPHIGHO2_01_FULL_48_27 TaxID=1802115 RepID=A0A1G2G2W4_9BACT|nr:MAG: hypothetical protein A2756_05585 [Candidatus Ryanbacteria bacterium RIFCSPHIGHO2_01_FULL_48_27]